MTMEKKISHGKLICLMLSQCVVFPHIRLIYMCRTLTDCSLSSNSQNG